MTNDRNCNVNITKAAQTKYQTRQNKNAQLSEWKAEITGLKNRLLWVTSPANWLLWAPSSQSKMSSSFLHSDPKTKIVKPAFRNSKLTCHTTGFPELVQTCKVQLLQHDMTTHSVHMFSSTEIVHLCEQSLEIVMLKIRKQTQAADIRNFLLAQIHQTILGASGASSKTRQASGQRRQQTSACFHPWWNISYTSDIWNEKTRSTFSKLTVTRVLQLVVSAFNLTLCMMRLFLWIT